MLDRMKDLGYSHSTMAGITVGIADIMNLHEKHEIIDNAHKQVETITKQFRRGLPMTSVMNELLVLECSQR